MAYTYEQLKHMTLADLREMAKGNEHEAVQGYGQSPRHSTHASRRRRH
jgi:hypothetical protein